MCGILGIAYYGEPPLNFRLAGDMRSLTRRLLVESQIRGRDASGLCVASNGKISMFKTNMKSSEMIKEQEYGDVVTNISGKGEFRSIIGHTRAKTKGDQKYNINNHPIKANNVIGVHNGMIHNDDILFRKHSDKIDRSGRVDSEIIFRLIDHYVSYGDTLITAVKKTDEQLIGWYSCAFIHRAWPNYLTIFTNGAVVPILMFDKSKVMVFASTHNIIRESMKPSNSIGQYDNPDETIRVRACGARINLDTGRVYKFELSDSDTYCNSMRMCI